MKNRDIYKIRSILDKWSNYKNTNLSYVILKNIDIANTLIDTFNKFIYNKEIYNIKKKQICDKYALKIEKDSYLIKEDYEEIFNKEMDELDFNYIKSSELLDKELKVNFFKIKKDDLPKNISANDLNEIKFMLE